MSDEDIDLYNVEDNKICTEFCLPQKVKFDSFILTVPAKTKLMISFGEQEKIKDWKPKNYSDKQNSTSK